MKFFIIIGIIAILFLILLILTALDDTCYMNKYKEMAKFNYFLLEHYYNVSSIQMNTILNEFYNYIDKEYKDKRKKYEKQLKKEFKKNIKDKINYIY